MASMATMAQSTDVQGIAGDVLIQYLQRVERLEEEKAGLMEGIKEVFSEAKNNGFDVKIMRELLKLRKLDQAEVDEQETLLDLYKQAIGMH